MTKPLFQVIRILAIFLALLVGAAALLWLTSSWRTFVVVATIAWIGAVLFSSRGGGQTEYGDGSGE